jgi:predicted transcriptional regulator
MVKTDIDSIFEHSIFVTRIKEILKWYDFNFPAAVLSNNEWLILFEQLNNINVHLVSENGYTIRPIADLTKPILKLCYDKKKQVLRSSYNELATSMRPCKKLIEAIRTDANNIYSIKTGTIISMDDTIEIFNNDIVVTEDDVQDFINNLKKEHKEICQTLNLVVASTNYRHTQIMRSFIFNHICSILSEDQIDEEEAEIIMKHTKGPIMFARNGLIINSDEYKCVDINSSYPSIYIRNDFLIPLSRPKFYKNIDDMNIIKNKCFLAEIMTVDEWVTVSSLTDCTNDDDNCALLQNIYVYEKTIPISMMLKKVTLALYNLKLKKNSHAKQCLNCIWGLFSAYNIKTVPLTQTIFDDHYDSIYKIHRGEEQVDMLYKTDMFRSSFARVKPFLLQQGRKNVEELISLLKNNDDRDGRIIARIHTDSVLSNYDLTILKDRLNTDIGNYKIETKLEPNTEYQVMNKLFVKKV